TTAAIPPCDQAEAHTPPNGFSERTTTLRGASVRAANNPAAPDPTITISALLMMSGFIFSSLSCERIRKAFFSAHTVTALCFKCGCIDDLRFVAIYANNVSFIVFNAGDVVSFL